MKINPLRDGKIQCAPEDSRDGFKGSETYLLEAINASYSHRKGYTIPATKLPVLQWLLEKKWIGGRRLFEKSPAIFYPPDTSWREGVSLNDVKRLMKKESQS